MKKNSGFKGESTFGSESTSALDADMIADEDELASGGMQNTDMGGSESESGTSGVADQVKETAKQTLEQGQQAAGQAIDKAKDSVKSQLTNQKEKAVSTLGSFTDALHQTGDQLRQSGQGVFGGYADSLAGQVDRAVDYLRENDIDDLAAQVESFARRQPALFIGGAFVVGVALARFLKSSQSGASYNGNGASYASTLPTPASAGALTTTTGDSFASSGRQDQFSDEALPDNRPMTAHDYVPGIGVIGGEASSSSETSTSTFNPGNND
ncbi:MAG: hypothetical protein V4671_18075 [Armatimonadota bacterium]